MYIGDEEVGIYPTNIIILPHWSHISMHFTEVYLTYTTSHWVVIHLKVMLLKPVKAVVTSKT